MILMFAKKSFIASIHRPSNRNDLVAPTTRR